LTGQLVTGSVPGVVLGAIIRVYIAADPDVFRILAAAVLAPVGLAVISLNAPGPVTPDWILDVAAGLGGLAGGWVGASLQPYLPERALRTLLGVLALALAALYSFQAPT